MDAFDSLHAFTTLHELLQDLDPLGPLQTGLETLLQRTAQAMGYRRMAVAIFDPKTNTISFDLFYGHRGQAKAVYTPGQGVTGQVVQTGRPIVVENMASDPRFLNKALGRPKEELQELAFVCVPVRRTTAEGAPEILGVLSADIPRQGGRALDGHRAFLEVLAAVIARQTAYLQESMAQKELWASMGFLGEASERAKALTQSKIVATSKAMSFVMGQILQVAPSKAAVLLRGESGTGKELIAEAIHNASPRRDRPLIRLNCAALPADLLESELFGHERGAFTGAVSAKKGRFELAHTGTLFLDEIGELSPEAQAKLLRALQEGEVQRVGSEKPITVDVRIICATHQPLEQLIKTGKFREDLYYRINVFPIFIPPLRERREDILPLAEYFLQWFCTEYGKSIKRISMPAIDLLTQYDWPGNVRELRNCMERATLICNEEAIRTYHLPPTLQTAESSATDIQLSFGEAVAKFEQEILIEALQRCSGNMLQVARDLRASYRIIHYKIKKYNIDPKKYAKRSRGHHNKHSS
jgi:Nif-specific regulatory protein